MAGVLFILKTSEGESHAQRKSKSLTLIKVALNEQKAEIRIQFKAVISGILEDIPYKEPVLDCSQTNRRTSMTSKLFASIVVSLTQAWLLAAQLKHARRCNEIGVHRITMPNIMKKFEPTSSMSMVFTPESDKRQQNCTYLLPPHDWSHFQDFRNL